MRRTTLTLRFLTLGLAVGATACSSAPAHARDAAGPVLADGGNTVAASAAAQPGPEGSLDAAAEAARTNARRQATQGSRSASLPGAFGAVPIQPGTPNPPTGSLAREYNPRLGRFGAAGPTGVPAVTADTIAVVGTEPMDAAVADQWREDLVVMDTLLRGAVSGGGGGASGGMPPVVLGVPMTAFLNRVAPTYVEGAGVVLTTVASFPLVPVEAASTQPERPRQRPSAWDRAKREITGEGRTGFTWDGSESGVEFNPPVEFDQAKVDALVDAVVKVLPEATNFRHLKDGEHVFVTVVGYGESGHPARLTLKAKKADIDAAARGAITPEAFKSRVTSRVSTASRPSANTPRPVRQGYPAGR